MFNKLNSLIPFGGAEKDWDRIGSDKVLTGEEI